VDSGTSSVNEDALRPHANIQQAWMMETAWKAVGRSPLVEGKPDDKSKGRTTTKGHPKKNQQQHRQQQRKR